MATKLERQKIVVFTGAGISAESGLQTFRDSGGLWHSHDIHEIATPEGWRVNPQLVLKFYNERRSQACDAEPNEAHQAIARLEKKYEVVVITQNVDDLHERGGSNTVIHLHGELGMARSSIDDKLTYSIGCDPISMGDKCDKDSQLRPHIVWFGEEIQHHELARDHIKTAAKVLVVGTSLTVYPAAGILKKAGFRAEKLIVSLEIERKPYGYKWLRGKAVKLVPHVINCWLEGKSV